ncbi:MAG: iron ABC transporter permease [Planctomycetes bacterium]|nr:iron ABC transporter permease [Planctomycetota bacterium]
MKLTARRYALVILVAAAVWLIVAAASLMVGPVNIFAVDDLVRRQMLESRIAEVVTAALVGAALAASGAAFQALLRNPLADPYILGVSGGASLGVILGTLLVPSAWLFIELPLGGTLSLAGLCGFVMALVAIVVVYLIAQRRGRLDPYRLILTGVVVSAFFSAAIMLAVALAGDRLRNELIFWLMGGLGNPRDQRGELALAAMGIVVGLGVFVYQAKGFNLLAFGEDVAASLGLAVERHRRMAFVVASLLAGISVSLAGPIGFVGLIVPHLVRMVFGSDHRLLVPLSVFGGAIFLMVAHRLVLLIPYEVGGGLPVGIVTAMCGVPFFILLLVRGRGIRGGVL